MDEGETYAFRLGKINVGLLSPEGGFPGARVEERLVRRVLEDDVRPNNQSKIEKSKDLFFCRLCKTFREPRAHHCRVMGYCVRKMDHYCPSVANTIGVGNSRYFVQFLSSTFIGLVYVFSFKVRYVVVGEVSLMGRV